MLWGKNKAIAYRYVLPTVIVVIIVGFLPILYSVFISLFDFELTAKGQTFVGLKNYFMLLTDTRFGHAARFTVVFALIATIAEVLLGFFLAYLLYSRTVAPKFSAVVRVLMLVPYMVAPIVISYTFKTLVYDVNYGYLNAFFKAVGIPVFNMFEGETNAALGVLIMEIFLRTPFTVLILYSGLSTIPEQLIEAAKIDGAGTWKRLTRMIIPILRPVIFVSFIFRFMDALKMFDEMYVLTRGGPGYSTENLSLYVSSQGFEFFHMGKASAAAVIFFLLVAVVTGVLYITFNIRLAQRRA